MAKTLTLDEMMDILREMDSASVTPFARRLEMLGNEIAGAIEKVAPSVISTPASCEESAFAGTCCAWFLREEGGEAPECFSWFDQGEDVGVIEGGPVDERPTSKDVWTYQATGDETEIIRTHDDEQKPIALVILGDETQAVHEARCKAIVAALNALEVQS